MNSLHRLRLSSLLLALGMGNVALAESPPATPAGETAKPKEASAPPAAGSAEAGTETTKPADWVDAPKEGEAKAGEAKSGEAKEGEAKTEGDEKAAEGKTDEKKEEGMKLYLGAHFRDFIVPNFIFSLFASGGPEAVNVFSVGPELVVRQGALEVVLGLTYADYSMNEFLFKAKDDPEEAFELVSSDLKLVSFTADLLGRIPFDQRGTVALLVGGGVGISGVFGNLYRTQAYPKKTNDADPSDPSKWSRCKSGTDGNVSSDGIRFCGTDNEHYEGKDGGWSDPYWSDGGSKPIVFPYLALPHLALEVTPVEEFMVRLDTGFSISGFFFGLGAGGKLPI